MSAWDSIKKAFSASPQQRHAEIQAKQIAEGKAFQCAACGAIYYLRRDDCPKCHTPVAGWPPEQKQLVRTYTGRQLDQDFQHDAAILAKAGWRVQSQNYGGMQGTATAVFGTAITQGVNRKAAQLTVVYQRD